ncbi:MAG: DIP1984 family protein [bacterium]|nr:DIP1984 family protein [bacterium]
MKLAEALLLRADMQKKLASLRERIGKNAIVQHGDEPHEDPEKLLEEAYAVLKQFESLVFRINQTNIHNTLPDGRSLTEAIAHRDTLVAQHSLIQHAIAHTQKEPDRYSMAEIKWVATLKVASLQKQTEDLAKKIRELNAAIQETNWKAELKQ